MTGCTSASPEQELQHVLTGHGHLAWRGDQSFVIRVLEIRREAETVRKETGLGRYYPVMIPVETPWKERNVAKADGTLARSFLPLRVHRSIQFSGRGT
jgi:hypothetical protein